VIVYDACITKPLGGGGGGGGGGGVLRGEGTFALFPSLDPTE